MSIRTLIDAARAVVVQHWESGDLAEAVRHLEAELNSLTFASDELVAHARN